MIIVNFNVIARPGKELGARQPDPDGVRLWNMFHEQTLGRLALVVDDPVNTDIFEHWLRVNNIKPMIYDILDSSDPVIKGDKIHLLSMTVGRSDWYVDIDPATCAVTLRMGIPTLLVGNPYVVRPEWSEGPQARAWDQIVEEVDRQALLRAERTWR